MIQNFGGGEILAIVILALVILGPDRIPEMARNLGKLIHKVRTMANGLQGQVQGMMDDPAMQPLKELGEFAARPRQKLAEYALEAEAEERARTERDSIDAAAQDEEPAVPGEEPATRGREPAVPGEEPATQGQEPAAQREEPETPSQPSVAAHATDADRIATDDLPERESA